ncbi:MAG: 50S ribosomal protein L16 [Parcubacteria group bacterium]|nr:50S ribosomal protein L16 [Parcubacteria group bacterium]
MAFQPRRIKHPKVHKGKLKKASSRGVNLAFGAYGLKAVESNWVKVNQIEAARRTLIRYLQKGGKIWVRVFPDKPRTARSPELGMGGGAGALSHFVAPVEAGRILFELDGISEDAAREAFKLASHKLPVKTRFVKR